MIGYTQLRRMSYACTAEDYKLVVWPPLAIHT